MKIMTTAQIQEAAQAVNGRLNAPESTAYRLVDVLVTLSLLLYALHGAAKAVRPLWKLLFRKKRQT